MAQGSNSEIIDVFQRECLSLSLSLSLACVDWRTRSPRSLLAGYIGAMFDATKSLDSTFFKWCVCSQRESSMISVPGYLSSREGKPTPRPFGGCLGRPFSFGWCLEPSLCRAGILISIWGSSTTFHSLDSMPFSFLVQVQDMTRHGTPPMESQSRITSDANLVYSRTITRTRSDLDQI